MKQFADIRAIICDLDGTLLDTSRDITHALNAMLAEFGLPALALERVEAMVGRGSEDLMRRALGESWSGAQVAAHIEEALLVYLAHYRSHNGKAARVYPQVREALSAFRARGLKLACVTNKPLELAEGVLKVSGLRAEFDQVVGGDSYPLRKPHPMPLLGVCETFDLTPRQVLMLGDSAHDAAAARAAGCPVLLVPYGYNHGEGVQRVDADGIIQTLLDAIDWLLPLSHHAHSSA